MLGLRKIWHQLIQFLTLEEPPKKLLEVKKETVFVQKRVDPRVGEVPVRLETALARPNRLLSSVHPAS